MSDERAALNEIADRRAEWVARISAGDLEGYLGLMTADVAWLPPRGPALVGVAALRAWLAPFLAQYHYDFTVSAVRARVAGDCAFDRGTYRSVVTPRAGGEPAAHDGRYAIFWRRDVDGYWRIDRYADEGDLR